MLVIAIVVRCHDLTGPSDVVQGDEDEEMELEHLWGTT